MRSTPSHVAEFLVFLFAATVQLAAGVQQEDLEKFFTSATGLSMPQHDAAALASKERVSLTECGITVLYLQKLRDTMYNVKDMDLSISDIRENILWVAYQHADPSDLKALYGALSSSVKLDLSKTDAQKQALFMAAQHAEPYLLGPLYEVLYSTSKVNLPKRQAQTLAVNLTLAGADAGALEATYMKNRGLGKVQALQKASIAAVEANLDGLDMRYVKNAQAYSAKDVASYYGNSWLGEWSDAPKQKRTAQSGADYFASEFKAYYGASWSAKWSAAPVATLYRVASDGKKYTMEEFRQHFGDDWQRMWFKSYEILDLCAGLNQATCKGNAKCQWKWNGDWTTSCVPSPLEDAVKDATLVV